VLLWNQFQVAPYIDASPWATQLTVTGENPGGRCTAEWLTGSANLSTPARYYDEYIAADDKCAFLSANAITGWEARDDAALDPLSIAGIVPTQATPIGLSRFSSAIAYQEAQRRSRRSRRLQQMAEHDGDGDGPPMAQIQPLMATDRGAWYRVHLDGVHFAIDLTIEGMHSSTRVPLNYEPPPLGLHGLHMSADDEPVDPDAAEVRFLHDARDTTPTDACPDCTESTCALIEGAVSPGTALFASHVAVSQTPGPEQPRLCRFDLVIYIPDGALTTDERGRGRGLNDVDDDDHASDFYVVGVAKGSASMNGLGGRAQTRTVMSNEPLWGSSSTTATSPPPSSPLLPPSPPALPSPPAAPSGGISTGGWVGIVLGIIAAVLIVIYLSRVAIDRDFNQRFGFWFGGKPANEIQRKSVTTPLRGGEPTQKPIKGRFGRKPNPTPVRASRQPSVTGYKMLK
jgi:hypothetical protein